MSMSTSQEQTEKVNHKPGSNVVKHYLTRTFQNLAQNAFLNLKKSNL